eukprot:766647-Hanusia_phi.AAC.2
MEEQLAKIVNVRKFMHRGGIVVREGQPVECLYQVRLERYKAVKSSESFSADTGNLVLFANIVDAIQIAALDPSGTSDPYVIVRVGTREGQTEVKLKTLSPIWEQTLKIEVEEDADNVEVSVWDYDAWGDHDFLGLVEVPLKALKADMHKFHKYALPLKDDERYSGLVDEHMASKGEAVSGFITFFLQLTTDKYLDRVETLMSDENQVERSIQKFLLGSIIGLENFLSKGSYNMTVIVDQPAILLRVQLSEYENHIKPLQDNIHTRKLNFFRELSVFQDVNEERLNLIASSFEILQFRSGVIAREAEVWSRLAFIMSGEVNIYKSVHDARSPHQEVSHHREISRRHPDASKDELSKILMERDIFLSRLLRGQTIHLVEVLSKTFNAYTSVAATPVELLVSKSSTQIGSQRELLGERDALPPFCPHLLAELNDKWNSEPTVILDVDMCKALSERELLYASQGSLVELYEEGKQWIKYKEQLVSNVIFKKRERGTMKNGMVKTRESINLRGLCRAYHHEPKLPRVFLKDQQKATAVKAERSKETLGQTFLGSLPFPKRRLPTSHGMYIRKEKL